MTICCHPAHCAELWSELGLCLRKLLLCDLPQPLCQQRVLACPGWPHDFAVRQVRSCTPQACQTAVRHQRQLKRESHTQQEMDTRLYSEASSPLTRGSSAYNQHACIAPRGHGCGHLMPTFLLVLHNTIHCANSQSLRAPEWASRSGLTAAVMLVPAPWAGFFHR